MILMLRHFHVNPGVYSEDHQKCQEGWGCMARNTSPSIPVIKLGRKFAEMFISDYYPSVIE